MPKATV